MAGAVPLQGQVQLRGKRSTFARLKFPKDPIVWQAQHFRKVKYTFRGRRGTFARSSADFVARVAFSQGRVQNS